RCKRLPTGRAMDGSDVGNCLQCVMQNGYYCLAEAASTLLHMDVAQGKRARQDGPGKGIAPGWCKTTDVRIFSLQSPASAGFFFSTGLSADYYRMTCPALASSRQCGLVPARHCRVN